MLQAASQSRSGKIRKALKFGKEEEGKFTFSGEECMHYLDLEKITVVYRVTTGKLKPIEIPCIQSVPRGIPLEGKVKELAVSGMMATVGSCSWIAR